MIIKVEHEISAKLAEENQHNAALATGLHEIDSKHASIAGYYGEFAASVRGLELLEQVGHTAAPLAILDIGVGSGESTFLLADRGHQMSCIEPSPEYCRVIDHVATRFDLPVRVYQCTGEAAEALPAASFDVCVFNSSLHHCEDPVRALANCRGLLRPGGRVLVVNEPLLRFYRSHAWFQRQLEINPVAMGHYGGNEHSYHHGEYTAMLRQAGFQDVRAGLAVRNSKPRMALRDLLWREVEGKPVYGDEALLARLLWLVAMKHALQTGPLGRTAARLAMRLSLVHTSYVAVKH